ncbi:MAG: hypothetical protein NVS2B12_05070 [Ktedonobacteraceae bacterium]
MLYLRRFYRMLHLEDALRELNAKETEKYSFHDLRTPLVLTFDDGYHDNYTHAFALARELHVPITIFPVAGYVESGSNFWWQESELLIRDAQVETFTFEGHVYCLTQRQDRVHLTRAINAYLRCTTSVAQRETFLKTVREELAVSPRAPSEEEIAAHPLTWEQMREMEASGWVSFGAHTMHHPQLAKLVDSDEVRYEIEACCAALEQKLGHPIQAFAYPFGQPEEVGEEAKKAAIAAGYKWILTTMQGFNTPKSDSHHLQRIYGDVSRHWLVMAVGTAGIWKSIASLLQHIKIAKSVIKFATNSKE